ncbi:leucine-rich repeat receptor protein kinase EMS1-like [Lycium ferocissimum]|uniref:leucine-rich repeat receptor protein kinase EMS1-like n=1 Tax=Lycium ferocissimum TaxID=112874 RepID=UPI0028165E4E|nr:leucine-rich repeat receptor protein kinase EMS1-like [Lycium ferocissimum]
MLQTSCNHFPRKMQMLFLIFFFLISQSFQENLQFSSAEQSVLLKLKQHWSGSEFLQSWNLNSSACNWSGVSCIDDKVVTELHLGGKKITGTIPSIICQLNNLTFIDLSNNNISGTIPVSLKDCSMLQHLDLSNNSLRDRIPGELFGKEQLLYLYLNGNMLSGEMPKQISESELKYLYLSENYLNGSIPKDIGNLKNLVKLDLSHNSLSGSITNQLFQLHHLRHLSLSSNYLSGVIPNEMDLFSLYDMDLSHNQLTGSIPKGFWDLPGLHALDLSYNQLSGDISENIEHLRPRNTLRLCSNKFSGRISAEFVKLTHEENCFDESNLCTTSKNLSISGLPSCSAGGEVGNISRSKHLIIIIPVVGVVIAIQLIWIFYMVRKHWGKKECIYMQLAWIFSLIRKRSSKTKKQNVKDDLKFISFQKLKVTMEDILSSLKDENIIGNGGSGKVYRVVIDQTGNTYAVKSIGHGQKTGGRPQKEFLAEVRILGSIRHNNIVKLMCCISSADRKLLVYEYFEKQSLDKWLHRKKRAVSSSQSSTPALDWRKRLNIAIGAAEGLCYMHHHCPRPIIHRDIKSSNILLDSEFNAKIADFGLAKILARRDDDPETASPIAGTFGYIAPEYASTFKVNVKTDIYSYGVVLLELTTGREAIIRDEQINLAQWALQSYREGNSILEALDEEVMEISNLEQMRSVFKLGVMCTGASPSGRPSMKEVCDVLQSC